MQFEARSWPLRSLPTHLWGLASATTAELHDGAAEPLDAHPGEDALLETLIASLEEASPNLLSRLTGQVFTPESQPDFLAVRCGDRVSGRLWGDFTTAQWTDQAGSSFSWFGAGARPSAYVGVAVRYGQFARVDERERARLIALKYLAKSIGDTTTPEE